MLNFAFSNFSETSKMVPTKRSFQLHVYFYHFVYFKRLLSMVTLIEAMLRLL